MGEPDDESTIVTNDEAEIKELLGLFDVPAFARRGHDLEYMLNRLHQRLERERVAMLEMVQIRLRQWASVAVGPEDWLGVFTEPVAPLYREVGLDLPRWAATPGSHRKRRAIASDLATSVARFNRRWIGMLSEMKLDTINRQIEHYNRYYVLEKECVLGSARLAARHFVPKPIQNLERLLLDHPTLPVPELIT